MQKSELPLNVCRFKYGDITHPAGVYVFKRRSQALQKEYR